MIGIYPRNVAGYKDPEAPKEKKVDCTGSGFVFTLKDGSKYLVDDLIIIQLSTILSLDCGTTEKDCLNKMRDLIQKDELSYELIIKILEMKDAYECELKKVIEVLNNKGLVDDIIKITRFNKESNGDYSEICNQELIDTIKQVAVNNQKRLLKDK